MKLKQKTAAAAAAALLVAGLSFAAGLVVLGPDIGVHAQSTGSFAVLAEAGDITGASRPFPSSATGVVGIGSSRGTYGSSENGMGVYGISTGNYGVWGQSDNWRGVTGRTDRSDNNYGLYTPDNFYSMNLHLTGSFMQVVENGGSAPLSPGDVAVFAGINRDPAAYSEWAAVPRDENGTPLVVQVAKAHAATAAGVAGVVYRRFNRAVIEDPWDDGETSGASVRRENAPDTEVLLPGDIQPGELLLLVVRGAASVNVDSRTLPLEAGMLLSTGEEPGRAADADAAGDGYGGARERTVRWTLEAIHPGQQTAYVYVSPR